MGVTSGFFNSLNGDRKYDAIQVSSMFDGLIIDGVFASIGTAFVVKADQGLNITAGIGKAWFNKSWLLNDSILPMTMPASEVLLDRIDAVILDFDGTESVRENNIQILQGTPSSNPVRPTLAQERLHEQRALCYIYRAAGSDKIVQADITNMVGKAETPFVISNLQTISLDELLGRWEDELDRFMASEKADVEAFIDDENEEFKALFEQVKADLLADKAIIDQWIATEQTDFLAWYASMRDQLSNDAAGNLQLTIDKEEIKRILLVGFADGSKVFSEDGTSIVSTASDGRKLIKTFTNGFLTMTNVLESTAGANVARMVKTFDASGLLINTVVTYYP